MSTSPQAAQVPPIEQLGSEVIATLLSAARAYLEPSREDPYALGDAQIAIDIAAEALRRMAERLPQSERSVLSNVLTQTRLECVRRRS